MTKYLIINADDFGMSKVFNEVILDLIKKKLILSTSVLVTRVEDDQKEQFDDLILFSKNMNLSIGLHLEFETNDYSSQIKIQFEKFKSILGFNPSHIDIHRSRSFKDSFSDVVEFCKNNNFPVRNRGKIFEELKTTELNAFFGSIADFNEIEEWITKLEDGKYYEILFHPGKYDSNCKSSLNKDRERDVEHIEKLNSILEDMDVAVVSYNDLVAKF
ncbi:ChbG/HpnK family deacetylase [Candidatus Woesearchaeota archaeon]|jgi:predicted glycoside hydrolase/deacetylase ChbG (UPF0249 family)|nr:ChbG/HpnK family deacetylase [Candidatus Woesearchaeota archaeon]